MGKINVANLLKEVVLKNFLKNFKKVEGRIPNIDERSYTFPANPQGCCGIK